MYAKLLIESLCAGLIVLLVGLILHVLLGHHALHKDSPKMKEEMMRLSVLLFLTGFVSYLLFDLSGMTQKYMKYKSISSKSPRSK